MAETISEATSRDGLMARAARVLSHQLVRRLHTDWFEAWHPDLDAAISALPSMEMCPPDLYRQLAVNRGAGAKRTALVTDRGAPVAVIALRREADHWTPVTTWIVPGVDVPVRDGCLLDALVALEVPVRLAWWRRDSAPPASHLLEDLQGVATHQLTCVGDFEAFWKESGQWRHVQKARKKCSGLTVAVNRPGAAEWTIRSWSRRWAKPDALELPTTDDHLLVARYWEPHGRHVTISLLDGDRIAASDTVLAHGTDIVGLINYRDPAYDELGIGTRMLDATQQWAVAAHYRTHDFGGGFDYKRRWAPPAGMRWTFMVRPHPLANVAKAVWNRVRSLRAL